ncbi:unnamed protein product [Peronospora destructor]|uniref:CHORD domain-containing protein n=1 Tax=Peronospora destructor TaxID=86335 RepID=A0AAV0UV74_9STRA|nr:unnamed protein product [Peronospora destructor]
MHLEKKGDTLLFGDKLLHTAVQKYDDLFLKAGASTLRPVRVAKSAVPTVSDKKYLQCKNHGCQQKFLDEENSDQACRHQSLPPLFHDMKRAGNAARPRWCFENIEPCIVGRHSTVGPNEQFAISPTVAAAANAAQEYVVAENNDTSCRHHAGAPVFQTPSSTGAAARRTSSTIFDSFLKLPGCVVSAHTDVKTA